MSAQNIPYQLRPNKFIDRQVFVDLLSRILPTVGVENYAYVSMGGRHLVDHSTVYRQLGIRHLLSFDMDPEIVRRQLCNKPIDVTVCWEMKSSSLPSQIDSIFEKFDKASNLVVWLDYTNPNERLTQLQELIEVLKCLKANDILRITLNAQIGSIEAGNWRQEGHATPGVARLAKLKGQLGELVPTSTRHIDEANFPIILANCVGLAVAKAELECDEVCFKPILATTYKDGQRMMTVAIRAVDRMERSQEIPGLTGWPLRAAKWDDVVSIEAPDLSMREKLKIDQYLNKPPSYILRRLHFMPAEDHERSLRALQSYKQLHRYYPAFHHVES
ncbi:MAG: hypothetical protein MJA83_07925 [Gammaproteobacteria bacterium]|nr:hypothetical protein [Gammaproteobacteria bacterium]